MSSDTPRWVLTTQADIDECAEGLCNLGWPTNVRRVKDSYGNSIRQITIDPLPDNPGKAQRADLGAVVIVIFGIPQVTTLEQYQNSPFYEDGE